MNRTKTHRASKTNAETGYEEQRTRNEKLGTRNYLESRREQIILYAPLLIWIGLILFLGSGQGSMTQTSLIIRPILEFLFPTADELTLQLYHGFVRKLAHFTEYAILAFLSARAFAGSSSQTFRRFRFLIAFLVVVAVAGLDEFKQSFDPSRTGAGWDVVLDAFGGAAMLSLLALLARFRGA